MGRQIIDILVTGKKTSTYKRATLSSTTTSPSSVSATLLVGSPSGSTDHTWRRTRARAVWIRFSLPG